jgi:hypothetical protein
MAVNYCGICFITLAPAANSLVVSRNLWRILLSKISLYLNLVQSDQKFEKKLPNFWKCSQNCGQITKAQIESQK